MVHVSIVSSRICICGYMYRLTTIYMYMSRVVHVSNTHSTRHNSASWPTSFKMYLKFELYLKTLLKCTFFPRELGQSTQYKLLDLAYLPRTISVRCRYTHGILYIQSVRYRRPTFIGVWYGGEVNSVTLMITLVTYACKLGIWIRPDPLICFPGPAHVFHLFSPRSLVSLWLHWWLTKT